MKKRSKLLMVEGCIILMTWLWCCGISFAQTSRVTDRGTLGTSYTLSKRAEKMMLSRDGSPAISVEKGYKIDKPGIYYLSYTANDTFTIEKFTILPSATKTEWVIKSEDELEEILKYTLENFREKATVKFQYGSFDVSDVNEILGRQIEKVTAKYPHLTIYSYTLTMREGKNPTVYIEWKYPESSAVLKNDDRQARQKMMTVLSELLTTQTQDFEREWAIYRYLIDTTQYSSVTKNGVKKVVDTPMRHTLQGTLVENIAVCDGYAKTFMYLMNACGIPTQFVVGTADGTAHAWNIVKIQNAYYHVDVTWADKDENMLGTFYDYFNENDSYMSNTHKWNKNDYPKCQSTLHASLYKTQLQNVYTLSRHSNWETLLKQIKKDNPTESSIIFYGNRMNGWQKEKLVQALVDKLNTSVSYRFEEKYDALILSYRKKG